MCHLAFKMMKTFLIFGCCLFATEGRYFSPEEKLNAMFSDTDIQQQEQISPIVVAKPLANFMASEYNRVTSVNQHLYRQSRNPYVACKEDDMTSCHMMVYLEKTLCSRSEPSANCEPSVISDDRKTCVAKVDLIHGEITSSMKCSNSGDQLDDVIGGDMPFFSNRLQEEDTDQEKMKQENGIAFSKKQWNVLDGYPWNI